MVPALKVSIAEVAVLCFPCRISSLKLYNLADIIVQDHREK